MTTPQYKVDDDDASPHCTEETSMDFIECFSNEAGAVSSCDGASTDDSQAAERPYRLYEKQRRQRSLRRMQREQRAEERARQREASSDLSLDQKSTDDPEQPLHINKAASYYPTTQDLGVPQYLYGAECQLLSLMLLLITTCVIVGVVNGSPDTGEDPARDISVNITDLVTISPTASNVATTAPPPFVSQPSVTTTATTALPASTTVSATTSSSSSSSTTPSSSTTTTLSTIMSTTAAATTPVVTSATAAVEEIGIIDWFDDLQNLNEQIELFAVHAMGTTVAVQVTLPPGETHGWYTTTEFVAIGTPCDVGMDTTSVSTTTLQMTSDTTLVVCQGDTVVATTTHLFANDWDTQQSYETVSLDGSSSAGLTLERKVPATDTTLVVAVVSNPDETVLRLPISTRQRHLRSDRKLWLDSTPRCPTNGVPLPRLNPTYPVSIWAIEAGTTRSDIVVCNANGYVTAHGTISLIDSEKGGVTWKPWN